MPTRQRVIILSVFAGVLLVMALFYNMAGDQKAEGGGPCFGLASFIFVVLIIGLWWGKQPPKKYR